MKGGSLDRYPSFTSDQTALALSYWFPGIAAPAEQGGRARNKTMEAIYIFIAFTAGAVAAWGLTRAYYLRRIAEREAREMIRRLRIRAG